MVSALEKELQHYHHKAVRQKKDRQTLEQLWSTQLHRADSERRRVESRLSDALDRVKVCEKHNESLQTQLETAQRKIAWLSGLTQYGVSGQVAEQNEQLSYLTACDRTMRGDVVAAEGQLTSTNKDAKFAACLRDNDKLTTDLQTLKAEHARVLKRLHR
jgi:hypothetical protein